MIPTGASPTLRSLLRQYCDSRRLSFAALACEAKLNKRALYAALRNPAAHLGTLERIAECTGISLRRLRDTRGDEGVLGRPPVTPLGMLVADAWTSRGRTLADLVRRSGLPRSVVFSALAGASTCTPRTVLALARTLELDPVVVAEAGGTDTGHSLTRARLRSGMSVADLAARAGVSSNAVRKAETDKPVSRATAHRIRAAFGNDADLAIAVTPSTVSAKDRTELGVLVDRRAARHGTTIHRLSRRIGITRQGLTNILAGAVASPDPAVLDRLSREIDIPADTLRNLIAKVGPPHKNAGERLRARREQAKLSQRDVALVLGVSRHLVSNWERGVAQVSQKWRGRLLDVLDPTRHPSLRV
jgi:transcriptional regulator with XRE-family HTH domain